MLKSCTLSTLQVQLQLQPLLLTASSFTVLPKYEVPTHHIQWVAVCHPSLPTQHFLYALSVCINGTTEFAFYPSQELGLHEVWCVQVHRGGPTSPANSVSLLSHCHWQLDRMSVTQVYSGHPMSLEAVALPQSHLHLLDAYCDIGELLLADHPAAALSAFSTCYYTSRVWNGARILEYELCVGESLRRLLLLEDAKVWLWGAYHAMNKTIDPVDENLTNCMASLGVLCLRTQELQKARSMLERVALLDELEEGPTSLTTLESQLNVAAVYRNECRYEPALQIVQQTLSTMFTSEWEPGWCDLLCKSWELLGALTASIGDIKGGCNLIERAFILRFAKYPRAIRTWTVFAKWYWFMIHGGLWFDAQRRLKTWRHYFPKNMSDWPGKTCKKCCHIIYGAAYTKICDAPFTYLYCERCYDGQDAKSYSRCSSLRDFVM